MERCLLLINDWAEPDQLAIEIGNPIGAQIVAAGNLAGTSAGSTETPVSRLEPEAVANDAEFIIIDDSMSEGPQDVKSEVHLTNEVDHSGQPPEAGGSWNAQMDAEEDQVADHASVSGGRDTGTVNDAKVDEPMLATSGPPSGPWGDMPPDCSRWT